MITAYQIAETMNELQRSKEKYPAYDVEEVDIKEEENHDMGRTNN